MWDWKKITKIGGAAALGVLLLGVTIWHDEAYLAAHKGQETFSKGYGLTLTDMNGNPVRLSDFKNQIVIAYAWASWCPYCGDELEDLAKLKATYGDKVQIVAINRGEPAATAQAFIAQLQGVGGITFLLDPTDSFYKSINGYAMPETVFIEQSGVVAYHQHGPITSAEATQELQAMLNE